MTLKGTYPIKFKISFVDYTLVEDNLNIPFTVAVINSCDAAILTNTGPLPNQEYTLTDSDKLFTIDLNLFNVTPTWCTISFALGGGALPAGLSSIVTFDAPSRQFTISSASISDLSLSGSS